MAGAREQRGDTFVITYESHILYYCTRAVDKLLCSLKAVEKYACFRPTLMHHSSNTYCTGAKGETNYSIRWKAFKF